MCVCLWHQGCLSCWYPSAFSDVGQMDWFNIELETSFYPVSFVSCHSCGAAFLSASSRQKIWKTEGRSGMNRMRLCSFHLFNTVINWNVDVCCCQCSNEILSITTGRNYLSIQGWHAALARNQSKIFTKQASIWSLREYDTLLVTYYLYKFRKKNSIQPL